jgi:hypothetical protein
MRAIVGQCRMHKSAVIVFAFAMFTTPLWGWASQAHRIVGDHGVCAKDALFLR